MQEQIENEFDVFTSAWLDRVPKTSLSALREITEFKDYRHKDTIYALGGPQNHLWGIARGKVKVLVAMAELDPVLGHIHHPGAWFGESELIHGLDGIVEMEAIRDTRLAKIPYKRFYKLAYNDPTFWEAFARLTSMNQLLAMSAANDLALRTSKKRLAATILRLCGKRGVLQGSRASETVLASQSDIATLANVSPSKASIHLGDLARKRLIKLEYGRVIVMDEAGLTSEIDNGL